ncbi:molybdate ABC transporter substrate-binding protein [Minwuia sp.]|uniref:molybdate ABC transporter substrate-binding protein n=1 Tax=Minwuia sp. TaxID=2493630 RepID=UPI003A94F016
MRGILICLAGVLLATSVSARELTIFAASSMTEVVDTLAERFQRETRIRVKVSYAGSSVLARQIRRGAPADMIISANTDWIDRLEDGNAIVRNSRRIIATNRLVLVARADDADAPDTIDAAMQADDQVLLAIADPSHVPAGQYTRQALTRLGYWNQVSERTIHAGNVRSAIAFLQRRAARFGIAYRTDALAFQDIREIAAFPADSHAPILYETAVTFQGQALNRENVARFMDYLHSDVGLRVMSDAGFIPCPDGC